MKVFPECIPCHVLQASRISDSLSLNDYQKFIFFKDICSILSKTSPDLTPVEMAVLIYDYVKDEFGSDDVLRQEKISGNLMAEKIVNIIKSDKNIKNKNLKFYCLASALGNIIDLGAHDVDLENIEKNFIDKIESSEFLMDDFKKFENKLEESKSMLFILDNCGEAVFDRLLIEKISFAHPHLKITAAVREVPIINDITLTEAYEIKLNEVCETISSGSIYPGTLLEKTSRKFREIYDSSDLIISKGQGNLEGLYDNREERLFFCLTVKCKTVANLLNVEKGCIIFSNFSDLNQSH